MTIICVCERVTRDEIEAARDRGATSLVELARTCGAGSGCGACHGELREILASPRSPPHRVPSTAT
jgi:bacterioferritin-associated ferredoxin